MYKVPDVVPPIHGVSSHVAANKDPSKFRSIFSDNLQPIATRGKKARSTLLVDIGCSSKRAPLSVSYYNEISGGHIWRVLVRRRGSAGPVLPLWIYLRTPRASANGMNHTCLICLTHTKLYQCLSVCVMHVCALTLPVPETLFTADKFYRL